jgi:23S rRNA A2030 N6-methylase RlmJ
VEKQVILDQLQAKLAEAQKAWFNLQSSTAAGAHDLMCFHAGEASAYRTMIATLEEYNNDE